MQWIAFATHMVVFVVMWSLPVLFFENKDGKLNINWILTALPFAVGPTLMIVVNLGVLDAFPVGASAATILRVLGMVLALASAALVVWTWRTHRVRLSLWHMENDAPQNIVTTGPYALMRHPFYTSFLVCAFATVCNAPHLGLVATFIYAFVMLDRTAAREEARLATSQFGAEYVAYMQRTPRFFPWPRSGATSDTVK